MNTENCGFCPSNLTSVCHFTYYLVGYGRLPDLFSIFQKLIIGGNEIREKSGLTFFQAGENGREEILFFMLRVAQVD